MSAGPQFATDWARDRTTRERSPLAQLLHALNQPLTGLQCSLELAVAGPRPTEYYTRTLRESLELTARMRILVEAIRELTDAQQCRLEKPELICLDSLLHDTIDDLRPVADTKNIRLCLAAPAPLTVRIDRKHLESIVFRLLESALSLAQEGTALQIITTTAQEHACLLVSWNRGPVPEQSPFSRQELGLLIAEAGWRRAGAQWTATRTEAMQTCSIRLPLASSLPHSHSADSEI
jgi:signal transduction histidine kinase